MREPWFPAPREMFYRGRVAFKKWLSRHRLMGEFCKGCGRTQPLVWAADDVLWSDLCGNWGGVLCPECFDARALARGVFLRWIPEAEVSQADINES